MDFFDTVKGQNMMEHITITLDEIYEKKKKIEKNGEEYLAFCVGFPYNVFETIYKGGLTLDRKSADRRAEKGGRAVCHARTPPRSVAVRELSGQSDCLVRAAVSCAELRKMCSLPRGAGPAARAFGEDPRWPRNYGRSPRRAPQRRRHLRQRRLRHRV